MVFIAEKRRLDYACRRGTRELETLVRAFFELYYDSVNEEKKSIFRWLLSMEDDRLWDWIYAWGNDGQHHDASPCIHKNRQVKTAIEQYIQQRNSPPL